MKTHRELTDMQFEAAFASCELDAALFSHEAHLRLAWIHINQNGIEQALVQVPAQIQAYVVHLGAQDKYNHTLTIAAIRAVYHFWLKSGSDNFPDFIQEFPRLNSNFKGLMACHYGFDIYRSKQAKIQFLEPDLLPFD